MSSVALWLWVNGGKKRQNCAFKHGKKHTCDLYPASLKRRKGRLESNEKTSRPINIYKLGDKNIEEIFGGGKEEEEEEDLE